MGSEERVELWSRGVDCVWMDSRVNDFTEDRD
jgi:hypothetical protein